MNLKKKITKKAKYLSITLLLISTLITGCADKELIASQIGQPIIYSGTLEDYKNIDLEIRKETYDKKHIEVSGIATDVGYTLLKIGDDKEYHMEFSCTFENEIEGIEEGDIVKVHGVCDGCFDDTMFLYGCELTEIVESVSETETSSDAQEKIETDTEAESESIESTERNTEEKNKATEEEIISQETAATEKKLPEETANSIATIDLASIPAYSGSPYVAINNNVPTFTEDDLVTTSYEYYSELDSKGRCGICIACIGPDIMPTEERGSIGDIKPSGWNQEKYIGLVDGNYLYNRCHLIGYQLTGENANTRNLITGTRYMNVDGMLPFENMVADYVKETENHVLMSVKPIFQGDNLVASGVHMQARSVEDNGEGVLFNVYCYNVQPGINITYSNGASEAVGTVEQEAVAAPEPEPEPAPDPAPEPTQESSAGGTCWKSATGSKYHSVNNCGRMNPNNATQITVEEAINMGLERCSKCY